MEDLSFAEWAALRDQHLRDQRAPEARVQCHYTCVVVDGGEIVWQSRGDPRYLGSVHLDAPLALPTLRPRVGSTRPVEAAPPAAPVGPLLAYRLVGDVEVGAGGGLSTPVRVVLEDLATGESWRAYEWHAGFDAYEPLRVTPDWCCVLVDGEVLRYGASFGKYEPLRVFPARNGFVEVEGGTVRHVTVDGARQPVLLADYPLAHNEMIGSVEVSPDGTHVAVMLYQNEEAFWGPGEGPWPPAVYTVYVFDLATGSRVLEKRYDIDPTQHSQWGASAYEFRWSDDASLLGVFEWGYERSALRGLLSTETGVFTERTLRIYDGRSDYGRLSPSLRYLALEDRDELTVKESLTGRVLHQVDGAQYWTWMPGDRLAWSRAFRFSRGELVRDVRRDDVSILDVAAGDLLVVDSSEFSRHVSPDVPEHAGATVECEDERSLPCRVVRHGEVLAEGMEALVLGVIELEPRPRTSSEAAALARPFPTTP